ncbi:unnamed protein product [Angiostrongylus costaricensis]|uniref:DB domain-containing protein n=1 Tax=Angiostrongylus costaricensis TaxID=334426 RepID=A0A158PD66_ANGCS|nr:unnamed protein product [Angiostrongylus costaricensis]
MYILCALQLRTRRHTCGCATQQPQCVCIAVVELSTQQNCQCAQPQAAPSCQCYPQQQINQCPPVCQSTCVDSCVQQQQPLVQCQQACSNTCQTACNQPVQLQPLQQQQQCIQQCNVACQQQQNQPACLQTCQTSCLPNEYGQQIYNTPGYLPSSTLPPITYPATVVTPPPYLPYREGQNECQQCMNACMNECSTAGQPPQSCQPQCEQNCRPLCQQQPIQQPQPYQPYRPYSPVQQSVQCPPGCQPACLPTCVPQVQNQQYQQQQYLQQQYQQLQYQQQQYQQQYQQQLQQPTRNKVILTINVPISSSSAQCQPQCEQICNTQCVQQNQVPWIIINGVRDRQVEHNLQRVLCIRYLKPRPDTCAHYEPDLTEKSREIL